jgi:CRP-like cAMP-binding protein
VLSVDFAFSESNFLDCDIFQRIFQDGEYIIRQGAIGRTFYILTYGEVRRTDYNIDKDHRSFVVGISCLKRSISKVVEFDVMYFAR